MNARVRLGRTNLSVSRIGVGVFPFGAVNRARGWDPYTPEGRKTAISTIHTALDAGINYIDTAPGYGQGNSESIVGDALQGRRDKAVLATKVGYDGFSADDVSRSFESSLQRLRTDYVDLLQFHGGMFTTEQTAHILDGGLLGKLEALRDQGKVRFFGFTAEEPWTALPLIASGRFDVVQLRYNIIYQSAAHHALPEARAKDMGVAAMRPMTSGMFQRIAEHLAPQWSAQDIYAVALKFVLADSRVHVANVGMRWPSEVQDNLKLVESFQPDFDIANLPRWTAEIYRTEDEAGDAKA
jgi:aryl-alcohol dehydrogenase-like predicted oxidoreductase